VTILLIAGDANGVAAAADSWTYMGDEVEHPDQTKVFSLFDTFLVATAGSEYILDGERYDFSLRARREFSPDRWDPDKPRDEYRRHHLAGESSISEVLTRWAGLQARKRGLVERVRREPDVEEFHTAITEVMRACYRDEREFAAKVHEKQGKLLLHSAAMSLVSLGYRPDGNAYIFRTHFLLEPLDFSDQVSQIGVDSGSVPGSHAFAKDIANDTEWWVDDFTSLVDNSRAAYPPGKALGVALEATVKHCIENQSTNGHLFGGRVKAGYVSPDGAAMVTSSDHPK